MGCGSSTNTGDEEADSKEFDFSRRNTLVQKPEVSVTIGSGVKKIDKERRIVFIFGGPGSCKGFVVNDLISMFGFAFISAEDLLIKHLPKKISDFNSSSFDATHKLAKFIEQEPELLTLEWVLELVGEEVDQLPVGQPILIDMIPNLRFMMKVKTFIKNCDKEMTEFEKKYPCAFGMNLTLSKETLLKNITASHACVISPPPPDSNKNERTGSSGDEMDTKRTQRRFTIYTNSVHDFINYFAGDERLVTVDTSASTAAHIWEAIMDFFAGEMDFTAKRVLDTVVLFAFDERTIHNIDTERYPMKNIKLKDLVEDSYAPVVKLLSVLVQHLDQSALQWRCFLVDLSGTSLDDKSMSQFTDRRLMFVDVNIGQLDYFIHGLKRSTERRKSLFRKKLQLFKAVCSTENETLLFPEDTSTELCRRIAICMAQQRELK